MREQNAPQEVVPTELLTTFMSRFLGYGNPNAELWFVGMEEGGGSGLDELQRRLHAWHDGGRRAFEDLPGYHHRIGLPKNFVAPFPLQKTWAPLVRCLLAFRGEVDPTSARIREVQADGLGTLRGNSVLAELLPMPSPGVAHWPYAELAGQVPTLKDRKTYADSLREPRIDAIRAAIQSGHPKAVIFTELATSTRGMRLRERRVRQRVARVGRFTEECTVRSDISPYRIPWRTV